MCLIQFVFNSYVLEFSPYSDCKLNLLLKQVCKGSGVVKGGFFRQKHSCHVRWGSKGEAGGYHDILWKRNGAGIRLPQGSPQQSLPLNKMMWEAIKRRPEKKRCLLIPSSGSFNYIYLFILGVKRCAGIWIYKKE